MFTKRNLPRKYLYLLPVLMLVLVVVVLELTGTTRLFHKTNYEGASVANTAGADTKGEPRTVGQNNKNSSTKESDLSDNKATPASNTGGLALVDPSGNFVSNHRPNLSGTPAPNYMQSICNTTPGAQCQIIFTKDGVAKSLTPQTADRAGAVYWSWKLQDIGLTEGVWQIQAKATLGSQSKLASDAINLEVSP